MNSYFPWVSADDYWLIYIIAIILGLTVISLFVILTYRVHFLIMRSQIQNFQSALFPLLSGAVNYPDQNQEYKIQIQNLLKKKWQYQMLLDYLITMCYSFRGVYEERSKEIYEFFELTKLSERKLKSRRWDENVKGIIELSIVGSAESYKKILPLLEHRVWQVRKQSKIAIVELGKVKGLIEMESKMGTMSRWTFISVLSILHRSAFKISAENLEILIKSKNPSTRKLVPYLEKYAVVYS